MGVCLGPCSQRDVTMLALLHHKTVITCLVLVLSQHHAAAQFDCQAVGFYPHPSDCSQFYRCTDIWSNGQFQQYVFTCAEGTVFDPSISVCNWATLVPSCGGAAPTPPSSPATTATPAVTTPSSSSAPATYRPAEGSVFQCSEPGIVSDDNNCNKFWLCKEETEGSGVLESLLYRCPDGYLFSSSSLRCKKEDDISCVEKAETRNVNIIQLTESMLESFFAKWSRF